MKVHLIVALLLSVVWPQQAISQETRHDITWDRYWLRDNIMDLTVNVQFNDQLVFHCQVSDSEPTKDRYENILSLRNQQHFDECNATQETAIFVLACARGIDTMLPVVDSGLATHDVMFAAGQVNYFTSFSDGTVEGATNNVIQGGACLSDPPLKLTVSVAPTTSSMMMVSTSSSSSVTLTAGTTSTSTMVAATSTATTDSPPTSTSSLDISPTTGPVQGGVGPLEPLHCLVILLLATIYLIF